MEAVVTRMNANTAAITNVADALGRAFFTQEALVHAATTAGLSEQKAKELARAVGLVVAKERTGLLEEMEHFAAMIEGLETELRASHAALRASREAEAEIQRLCDERLESMHTLFDFNTSTAACTSDTKDACDRITKALEARHALEVHALRTRYEREARISDTQSSPRRRLLNL